MLNALIMSTDMETVKHCNNYIKTNFKDIKVIGIATDNTIDVFETLKEYLPDLILAEFRFFGVNSYQIIRGIHERYPKIRFILFGNYGDKEYMEKCEEFGLISIMYKPLKPAELARALKASVLDFNEQGKKKRQEDDILSGYKSIKYSFRDVFLRTLFAGNIQNESEITYGFNYFNMNLGTSYTVFVLRIDHFKKIVLTLTEQEKHLLIYKIMLIVKDKLKAMNNEVFLLGFNSLAIILGSPKDEPEYEIDRLISLGTVIKEDIFDKLDTRVTVGIGRTYKNATEIAVSYKEAECALRYRFYLGYNVVIPIQFVEPSNTITFRYSKEEEEKLIYAAAIGEYEYCSSIINRVFSSLRDCGTLPEKLVSKIATSILLSINRYLSEQNILTNDQISNFFSIKGVTELTDVDSGHAYLDNAIKNICDSIVKLRETKNYKILTLAKESIDKKYYETVSISKLALELGVTPEHLNNIFYSAEKKSVFEYVVQVRMEIAKKLMRETMLDDDMIAVKIGYDDGKHFRSVFRQYEGINANDYRSRHNPQLTRMKTI